MPSSDSFFSGLTFASSSGHNTARTSKPPTAPTRTRPPAAPDKKSTAPPRTPSPMVADIIPQTSWLMDKYGVSKEQCELLVEHWWNDEDLPVIMQHHAYGPHNNKCQCRGEMDWEPDFGWHAHLDQSIMEWEPTSDLTPIGVLSGNLAALAIY